MSKPSTPKNNSKLILSDLYSRNWLFIDHHAQKKLSGLRVLVCGSGLGSYIAEALLRTGVQNITVADGDKVELSNLNRQNYTSDEIGTNKAISLGARLRAIAGSANIEIIPKFLVTSDLNELIPKHDIVINTIDFDHPAFLTCSELCREKGVLELFPSNLGFGGSVIALNPRCATFRSYFKETDIATLKMGIIRHLLSDSPEYMKIALRKYVRSNMPYDPQLAISSFLTAALTAVIVVKLAKGEQIKMFPSFYYVDLT